MSYLVEGPGWLKISFLFFVFGNTLTSMLSTSRLQSCQDRHPVCSHVRIDIPSVITSTSRLQSRQSSYFKLPISYEPTKALGIKAKYIPRVVLHMIGRSKMNERLFITPSVRSIDAGVSRKGKKEGQQILKFNQIVYSHLYLLDC